MTPEAFDAAILRAIHASDRPMLCGEIAADMHRALAKSVPLDERDRLCTAAKVRDRIASLRHRGVVAVASRRFEADEGRIVSRFTATLSDGQGTQHAVQHSTSDLDHAIASLRTVAASNVLDAALRRGLDIAAAYLHEARAARVRNAAGIEPRKPASAAPQGVPHVSTAQEAEPPKPPATAGLSSDALAAIERAKRLMAEKGSPRVTPVPE